MKVKITEYEMRAQRRGKTDQPNSGADETARRAIDANQVDDKSVKTFKQLVL